MRFDFPFSAVVGQDDLKLALLLIAVDPSIGGVLISGERGTAKSTVARGLAGLLPDLATDRPAPFVELPLGATEDRVVGSLNISRILQDGKSELRSGLLARANGGVLYVDEVNLLPDALVDLLLDAAASGWVTVERDGISASEPARFVLIGTMNPEEGELRPQFLDRFGLCVQVRGPATPEARIEAIRQRLSFDDSPATAREAARPAEEALRLRIVGARDRLKMLAISDAHLAIVASLAAEHQADGIRGDLAVVKAARALAAWTNAATVTEEHIHRAAQFALVHRARHNKTRPAKRNASAPTLVPNTPASASPINPLPSVYAPSATTPTAAADLASTRLITDLIDSDQPGRHGAEAFGRQRIVGAAPFESAGTLAVGQTLVSAAVRGARVAAQGVALRAEDLKSHERRGAGSSHVLFLVDASGSMGTNRRLELAKGAALGLLKSSYQRRDEVALMSFRSDGTDLLLPFTRDVPKVERALSDVATGGRTPLARALRDATDLLQTRAPSLLVLFTDGRANVGLGGGDPWDETLAAAKPLRSACAGALVIDCERGPILLGRALILAEVLGAEYLALGDLDATALTIRIDRRLADL
jgi:magnesium chelatase subunit D